MQQQQKKTWNKFTTEKLINMVKRFDELHMQTQVI